LFAEQLSEGDVLERDIGASYMVRQARQRFCMCFITVGGNVGNDLADSFQDNHLEFVVDARLGAGVEQAQTVIWRGTLICAL
jgi:hypothetical protein